MRVVILCGGAGTRLHDYSLPKPLNMIGGRPAIFYVLARIPAHIHVDFVVAPHLNRYEFESWVRIAAGARSIQFHWLPYFTRGPVESAFLGLKSIQLSQTDARDEPIVFLDNDVLFGSMQTTHPTFFASPPPTAFLGFARDHTGSEAFSFIKMGAEGRVSEIQEKRRISDMFCCGVYGFATVAQFQTLALPLLSSLQPRELYMSMMFEVLLTAGEPVTAVEIEGDVRHIGSLKEVREALPHIATPPLRICLDLDSTLVTAPRRHKDYSTVEPIHEMIAAVRAWKAAGHTIIIHTARRMQTRGGNAGAALADVGPLTFQTLADFDIPYDEVYFGKPYADVYIDDKALNPYLNSPSAFGLFVTADTSATANKPLNAMPPNRWNNITLEGDVVVKRGPDLAGEIFYYANIPEHSNIRRLFPRSLGSTGTTELRLEHVKGIPFSKLAAAGLLSEQHLDLVFDAMDELHNTVAPSGAPKPTPEGVVWNWVGKLQSRFRDSWGDIYGALPDAERVRERCLEFAQTHTHPLITDFIHGDLWFSNILLRFNNTVALLDMRGRVGGEFTTGGDRYYDYAKLWQSVCGYDAVLAGNETGPAEALRNYVRHQLEARGVDMVLCHRLMVTLVTGTLPFIAEAGGRERVWNWVLEQLG